MPFVPSVDGATLTPGQVAATVMHLHHSTVRLVVGIQEEMSQLRGRVAKIDLSIIHPIGIDHVLDVRVVVNLVGTKRRPNIQRSTFGCLQHRHLYGKFIVLPMAPGAIGDEPLGFDFTS